MFPVSTEEEYAPGPVHGARYLDQQLTLLGFDGRGANAELSRLSGVGESAISKARRGKGVPTRKTLRALLDAAAPRARQLGLKLDTTEFYIRFGLIGRDDVGQDQVHPIFVELVRVDREAGVVDRDEQQKLREHVQMLIEITQARLDKKRKQSTRRRAS